MTLQTEPVYKKSTPLWSRVTSPTCYGSFAYMVCILCKKPELSEALTVVNSVRLCLSGCSRPWRERLSVVINESIILVFCHQTGMRLHHSSLRCRISDLYLWDAEGKNPVYFQMLLFRAAYFFFWQLLRYKAKRWATRRTCCFHMASELDSLALHDSWEISCLYTLLPASGWLMAHFDKRYVIWQLCKDKLLSAVYSGQKDRSFVCI